MVRETSLESLQFQCKGTWWDVEDRQQTTSIKKKHKIYSGNELPQTPYFYYNLIVYTHVEYYGNLMHVDDL